MFLPLISTISTCEAPSLVSRVDFRVAGVMPEVFATAAAWVSVSAAMGMRARRGEGVWRWKDRWVIEIRSWARGWENRGPVGFILTAASLERMGRESI